MEWNIDPTLIAIGTFELRWYSLFFAGGFLIGYFWVQSMFRHEKMPEKHLDYILMVSVIGTIVGARIGHCFFYEPEVYLTQPWRIFNIREGGLASHGGFAGIMTALLFYCLRNKELGFFWLCDRMAIPTMLEAAFIRFGNFFNSEIFGHETSMPWGIVFSRHDQIARHPTQLYEALGYATVSAVLFVYYLKVGRKPKEGKVIGIALAVSFFYRSMIEFVKENQVAFEDGMIFNMGQLLSIPFIAFGLYLALCKHHNNKLFAWGFATKPVVLEDESGSAEKAEPKKKPAQKKRRQKRRR